MRPESIAAYNKLCEKLEGLIKTYRNLLNVVRKEKDILVDADLDKLNENNKAKEKLLIEVRKLEEERIKFTAELAKAEGLEESAKLLDFAYHFGGEKAERLRSIQSVLDLLLKRVKDYNQKNSVLVNSALANITGAMNSIKETLQDKPTYENKGGVKKQEVQAGQLVRREI